MLWFCTQETDQSNGAAAKQSEAALFKKTGVNVNLSERLSCLFCAHFSKFEFLVAQETGQSAAKQAEATTHTPFSQ